MTAKKTSKEPAEIKEPVTEETAGKAEKVKQKEVTRLVYCGPSIKDIVREGTVFTGGMPEDLKEYVSKHPEISSLIIPFEKFAEFRAAIGQKGTAANIIYNNVLFKTKEGR